MYCKVYYHLFMNFASSTRLECIVIRVKKGKQNPSQKNCDAINKTNFLRNYSPFCIPNPCWSEDIFACKEKKKWLF